MKHILATELDALDDTSEVIVNRVRLNSKLVEIQIKNSADSEMELIMQAIHEMRTEERDRKCIMMGATMRVAQVKKIFPEYKTFPRYSFATVDVV